jgi:xanthine dehydrogenase accessory factor
MSMSSSGGAMSDSGAIYCEIVRLQQAGQRAALAYPVSIIGSVPCVSQSRLLARHDGSFVGTIGGGPLEAEVLRRAAEVIRFGEPAVLDFELRQDEAAESGMVCGGSCSIRIDPILPDTAPDVFAEIAQGEARPPVYIFGAGHVAIPVAHLAGLVGFRTVVIDDRGEFANAARFPQADQVLIATVDEAFSELRIAEGAYVVIVTRGHHLDEEVAAHALRTPARYIGMIGSKRKVASIRQRLLDSGFSESDIARLHAPIGIDIGAETVEEIALSIVAELVAVRRDTL